MDMYEEEEPQVIERQISTLETICITPNEYYGLVTAVIILVVFLVSVVILSILAYR